MTGYVVFAHGSRVETANEAVRALTARVADRTGCAAEPAFLDCAQPELGTAVARLAQRGVEHVIVLPYFLMFGAHIEHDLPRIVGDIASRIPGTKIDVAPPLDGHPALLDILIERAERFAS